MGPDHQRSQDHFRLSEQPWRSIPRVVIVGAGGIGCTSAAYLVGNGYRPAMWSPNGTRMQRSGDSARFTCTGALSTTVDVACC